MKIEIDDKILAKAQATYSGADTTPTGLVNWLLRSFADRNIESIRSNGWGRHLDVKEVFDA